MKRGLDKLFNFLLCLLSVSLVAFIGSLFTNLGAWYYSIRPSITPPNWVFPVVWNILFILIAISLYLALGSSDKRMKGKILLVFGINFFLNILWSFLFFTLQSPLLGFIDVLLMIASIIWMIIVTRKVNTASAILLVPYLLWVMFASIINLLSI